MHSQSHQVLKHSILARFSFPASTAQIAVPANDTSNPTYCLIASISPLVGTSGTHMLEAIKACGSLLLRFAAAGHAAADIQISVSLSLCHEKVNACKGRRFGVGANAISGGD